MLENGFVFLLLTVKYSKSVISMIPVQIRMTKKLLELVDELIESRMYSNRSEAIREATRRLVSNNRNGY